MEQNQLLRKCEVIASFDGYKLYEEFYEDILDYSRYFNLLGRVADNLVILMSELGLMLMCMPSVMYKENEKFLKIASEDVKIFKNIYLLKKNLRTKRVTPLFEVVYDTIKFLDKYNIKPEDLISSIKASALNRK